MGTNYLQSLFARRHLFASVLFSLALVACGGGGGGSGGEGTPENAAPVANAGTNQSVITGTVVNLDGSNSSDADGDLLTYQWIFVSRPVGSSATLVNASTVTPAFTPDSDGEYVIQLIVNDGQVNSAASSVTIASSTGNAAPVANAGTNQSVSTGTVVNLDGSNSSDANNDLLTYQWIFVSIPVGSSATLVNASTVTPAFTPDSDGEYVIQLIVNDGQVDSAASSVTITSSTGNAAPVANAGSNQNASTGTVVNLDGSNSSDANNDLLTYQWIFVSRPVGSSATLVNASTVTPAFTPDSDGEYVIQLIVNDGQVDSAASSVTITSSTTNAAPVANAGTNQSVSTGTVVNLDGSNSSDADGDLLTYQWIFVSRPVGSSATLVNASTVTPAFTPDSDGEYVIQLIVNDGQVDSAASLVTITSSTSVTFRLQIPGENRTVTIFPPPPPTINPPYCLAADTRVSGDLDPSAGEPFGRVFPNPLPKLMFQHCAAPNADTKEYFTYNGETIKNDRGGPN